MSVSKKAHKNHQSYRLFDQFDWQINFKIMEMLLDYRNPDMIVMTKMRNVCKQWRRMIDASFHGSSEKVFYKELMDHFENKAFKAEVRLDELQNEKQDLFDSEYCEAEYKLRKHNCTNREYYLNKLKTARRQELMWYEETQYDRLKEQEAGYYRVHESIKEFYQNKFEC